MIKSWIDPKIRWGCLHDTFQIELKWCLFLLSIFKMIKLQVVMELRLTEMHDYLNVPPCIICTTCIIWLKHGTCVIYRLRALRKYTFLCVSNVHNKEYAPLKQSGYIYPYILVWNIFSDLYVTCDLIQPQDYALLE